MQNTRACDLDAGKVPRTRYQPGLIGLRWCLARKLTLGLRAFACQRTESWFRDEEALELEQGVTFAGIVLLEQKKKGAPWRGSGMSRFQMSLLLGSSWNHGPWAFVRGDSSDTGDFSK